MVTITLPKIEYHNLKRKAAMFERIIELVEKDRVFTPSPTYLSPSPRRELQQIYLKGKAAKKLDHRVEKAIKEYQAGKTKIFKTIP